MHDPEERQSLYRYGHTDREQKKGSPQAAPSIAEL
jgi:hypothetical protein